MRVSCENIEIVTKINIFLILCTLSIFPIFATISYVDYLKNEKFLDSLNSNVCIFFNSSIYQRVDTDGLGNYWTTYGVTAIVEYAENNVNYMYSMAIHETNHQNDALYYLEYYDDGEYNCLTKDNYAFIKSPGGQGLRTTVILLYTFFAVTVFLGFCALYVFYKNKQYYQQIN